MLEIKSTNSAANVEIELDFIWIPRDAIEIIFPSTGTETSNMVWVSRGTEHTLKSYSPVRGRKLKIKKHIFPPSNRGIEIIFPSTGTERIVFYLAPLRGFFIIAS